MALTGKELVRVVGQTDGQVFTASAIDEAVTTQAIANLAPGGSPGGTTGQVQYNNGGAFGGIATGTTGQVLTSNGPGVPPSMKAAGGGGSAAGPAGTVQMSDGAGGFVVSDFMDLLTVLGSATVKLVNSVVATIPVPGATVRGTSAGALSVGPTETGGGFFLAEGFGSSAGSSGLQVLTANGTRDAPTEVLSGKLLSTLGVSGYDGSSYQLAAQMFVTAQSDFSGTPTSSIDLTNASSLGLHIAADGTFSVDHGIVVGVDDQTAVAGAATTTTPNVIVTSEALTGATSYALTLTSPFIATTSVIQVTAMDSAGVGVFLKSIVCSSGSAVITVGMAALTGTVVMNISVNN